MNNTEAISFYVFSVQDRIPSGEPKKSGWQRCVIYKGQHLQSGLGSGGSMKFFKLNDGRIILTNDLWYDVCKNGWSSAVPSGSLIGQSLSTRVCQPKSRKALSALLDMIENIGGDTNGFDSVWRVKKGLSDKDVYILREKFAGEELPEVTPRTFRSEAMYASFASPECAVITHIKVSNGPVVGFRGPDQFQKDLDPSKTPTFILYEEDSVSPSLGLQKGDIIHETYVYDFPEWTEGELRSSASGDDDNESAHGRYVEYDDEYYEEEDFTPTTGYYRTGQGDTVFAFQGEGPDYTACDSECGFCGRCQY